MSTNAEVVAWQSSRRIALAVAVGLVAAALRLFDVATGWLWPVVVALSAYVGLVAVVRGLVPRAGDVSTAVLVLLGIADLTIIFATVAMVIAPDYYFGALFLSLVVLQLTQLYFGWRAAIVIVVVSSIAYVALLAVAATEDAPIPWVREGSLLALYLGVAINSIVLHTSANRRLATLVDLFAAAQRGDFSGTFVEEPGREPDGITVLGRAYNHLRSELATIVMTDPSTGCLNRRGLDQVLERALANAARVQGDVALLAIDIDHFKEINDTAGHLAGDAVLRELAELLTRSARAGDVVARVGGDEFVVLLPGADNETSGVVAERVMDAIRAHSFRTIRGEHAVSASVGIASEEVTDPAAGHALRARADEALYVAKRLGRNRVVMWAPGIRSNATPPTSLAV